MTEVLSSQLDYIYFFYGLAFVLMAQTCFGMKGVDGRGLPWTWLAAFGLLHGLHEWLDLAAMVVGDGDAFQVVRIVFAVASYVCLAEFGRQAVKDTLGKGPGRWIYLPLLALATAGWSYGWGGVNATVRYALGFPGATLAGLGFFLAARHVEGLGRGWLKSTGLSMFAYAVTTGLVVPVASFFPACSVNTTTFTEVIHLPVQLVRGLIAVWTLISIIAYSRTICRTEAEDEVRGKRPVCSFIQLIVILAIVALGWLLTYEVGKNVEDEAKRNLLYRAKTAAAAVNPERVKKLTGTPDDLASPDYRRLSAQLKDIKAANPDCWSVYLGQVTGGHVIFLVTTKHEEPEVYGDSCNYYEDATEPDAGEYSKGVPAVYGPFHDACCSWYVGVAPVVDPSTGRPVAQLRMDIHAAEWFRLVALSRLACIVITLLFSLSVMAFFVAWRRSRESLARGAALEIAAMGLANEKKLRDITSVLGEGVFVLDTAGRVTFMNPEAERLLGWKLSELIGKDMHLTVHSIIPDGATRQLEDCPICMTLADGDTRRISDDSFVRKDGSTFPVDYVATPLMDDGEVTGVVTAFQDITERKKAGKEKDRLLTGISASTEGMAFTDEHDRYVFVNGSHASIYGYTPEELVGMSWRDITPAEAVAGAEEWVKSSLHNKDVGELQAEMPGVRKDGAVVLTDVLAIAVWDERGNYQGHVCHVRDITQKKHVEEELAERSRLASLGADVGVALTSGATLRESLQGCSDAMVKHLGAAFARIWTLDELRGVLELQASAGMYTNIDGAHARIPVGTSKVGVIASEKWPQFTNSVIGDPLVTDQYWAIREGMVAFAGHPLIVKDRVVGVMAMFSRRPLSDATVKALASIADEVALGIERARAEDAIHALSNRWQATFNAVVDSVLIMGMDRVVLQCNDATAALLGKRAEDIIGKNLCELIHGAVEPIEGCPVTRMMESRHREFLTAKLNGRWFNIVADPIFDDMGGIVAAVHTIADITDRKVAEDALKESETKFRSLVEKSLVGVYIIQDWRFVYVNPRLCEILGYTQEQLAGESRLLDFIYPDDKKLVEENIKKRTSGEIESSHYQVRWVGGDGRVVETELFGSSISFDGRPAVIGTMLDITERKKLERQRADFYAMVTHDLKSPLTAVMGYTDIILEDKTAGMDGETVDMVESIKKSSRKLLHMVDDFLTISRMESGIITMNESLVDVNELVAEAGAEAIALAQGKGLSIRLEVPEGQSWAVLDRTHVLRAVSNLVQNAVNYTPAGGSVTLSAGRRPEGEGEAVVISVSDNGPGIPVDEQGRVFEKYYRMARTAGIKGSGLGLAIVKAVAEAHKGRVELESVDGKGCIFRLVFPA